MASSLEKSRAGPLLLLAAGVLAALLGYSLTPAPRGVVPSESEDGPAPPAVSPPQAVAAELPAAGTEVPAADEASRARATLTQAVLEGWEAGFHPPAGTRIESVVVTWRPPTPGPEADRAHAVARWRAQLEASAHRVTRDSGPLPSAKRATIERLVGDLERALAEPRPAFREYLSKTQLQTAHGFGVSTVGWPEGNRCSRAQEDGLFFLQLVGPGGAAATLTVNEEGHRIDEFGNLDGLALSASLREFVPYAERALRRGGAAVGEIVRTPEGDAVELSVPNALLPAGLGPTPPWSDSLPPYLAESAQGVLGTTRMTVLLERGFLPSRVEILDGAGDVIWRLTCGDFTRVGNGPWIAGTLERVTWYPGGRLVALGMRCVSTVTSVPIDAPLLHLTPVAGLRLAASVGGRSKMFPLAATTPEALRAEVLERARSLRSPSVSGPAGANSAAQPLEGAR